ncbi:hypothetical protein MSIMFB_05663 [Mycobacterium simulans]|uniref:Uncharacterized protein n=1 Tax=Mycobacterium simulans TaxID=627089 RepID=A0A7Z7ITD2_9MYCO|nr:hypothetical protein MSIMFB_05663 [Mycobacterium simulans]
MRDAIAALAAVAGNAALTAITAGPADTPQSGVTTGTTVPAGTCVAAVAGGPTAAD